MSGAGFGGVTGVCRPTGGSLGGVVAVLCVGVWPRLAVCRARDVFRFANTPAEVGDVDGLGETCFWRDSDRRGGVGDHAAVEI